jgi:hypothetical protein
MLFKSVSNTNFSCVSTVELTLRIYALHEAVNLLLIVL